MGTILVIGASGFVGKRLAMRLLADGFAVRALARDPAKVADLAALGCDIVKGDIADLAAVRRAVESVSAVYVSIHTLSPQPANGARERFMDVEKTGLQNVIAACRASGARRIVYVTSLGIGKDAPSEWLRERWKAERLLLESGLDATIVRPGYIIGAGGRGFDTAAANAKKRVAIVLGDGHPMRTIGIDDLVAYLINVLDDARTFDKSYDVGSDDLLSLAQSMDYIADLLGTRRPLKVRIPSPLLRALAAPLERASKLPPGAARGFIDSLDADMIGDPAPIRALFPRELLAFREAAERALATAK